MPRAARKKSESGIYHVMLRGINRQMIFEDDEDRQQYLQYLSECKALSGFTLHAYCLMGNHIHLLIQEGREPLEQIFKRIGVRYVFWYNRKYKRSGPLFQDRFKSDPVNDDAYFLAVLRYIYQNPVKAKLCQWPMDYPWSSYRSLTEPHSILGLIDTEKTLELLPCDKLIAYLEAQTDEQFLDITPDNRLTDEEAITIMKSLCRVRSAEEFQMLNRDTQSDYLCELSEAGCSIRQLSRITGISKAIVEKTLRAGR